MTRRIAVVGGGAVGVTAAYDLARQGADVTLYEKSEIGGESTGRAAGVLYDAYAAPVDAALGVRALERFREFSGDNGFEFTETPYVWFARKDDPQRQEMIRERVERMQANDLAVELVDSSALAERYPMLRTDDIGEAAIARDAGRTIPKTYADAVAAKARAAGVEVNDGVEASLGVDPVRVRAAGEAMQYDAVLVAAGAHTKQLLAAAGIRIPLKPYRVQALTCEFTADAPMLYDATAGYYLRPHPAGLLAGDGTELVESDPDDWTRAADPSFRAFVTDSIARRLGGAAGPVSDSWAGLCTATPDGNPLLGAVADGVYVAAGWQGHGFMRAPAMAEVVAEMILGEDGISEFDPGRFDGDEAFEIVEGMAIE